MIEDLLDYLKVEDIQPMGVEVRARCPLHEKRTGSRETKPDNWSINRLSGRHHCFSCGYSGSLPKLVIDVGKVGLWDAHRLIREHDVFLEREVDEDWEPPLPASMVEEQMEQYGPPPERALARRRITRAAADRFGLRWDFEEAAWVIPITGPGGDLWGWQFKAPDYVRNRPPGVKKSKTLFGLHAVETSTVILVESPLDAVYIDSTGYPAVASYGANVSDIQMRLLVERFDEVTLALDNDKAGIDETHRLLRERWHHRISILIFRYVRDTTKDPGECKPIEIHTGIRHSDMAAFW